MKPAAAFALALLLVLHGGVGTLHDWMSLGVDPSIGSVGSMLPFSGSLEGHLENPAALSRLGGTMEFHASASWLEWFGFGGAYATFRCSPVLLLGISVLGGNISATPTYEGGALNAGLFRAGCSLALSFDALGFPLALGGRVQYSGEQFTGAEIGGVYGDIGLYFPGRPMESVDRVKIGLSLRNIGLASSGSGDVGGPGLLLSATFDFWLPMGEWSGLAFPLAIEYELPLQFSLRYGFAVHLAKIFSIGISFRGIVGDELPSIGLCTAFGLGKNFGLGFDSSIRLSVEFKRAGERYYGMSVSTGW